MLATQQCCLISWQRAGAKNQQVSNHFTGVSQMRGVPIVGNFRYDGSTLIQQSDGYMRDKVFPILREHSFKNHALKWDRWGDHYPGDIMTHSWVHKWWEAPTIPYDQR